MLEPAVCRVEYCNNLSAMDKRMKRSEMNDYSKSMQVMCMQLQRVELDSLIKKCLLQ